jgi:hypothetical protein
MIRTLDPMKGAKFLMQDNQDMYACRNNDFFSYKYFNGGLYKQLKGTSTGRSF